MRTGKAVSIIHSDDEIHRYLDSLMFCESVVDLGRTAHFLGERLKRYVGSGPQVAIVANGRPDAKAILVDPREVGALAIVRIASIERGADGVIDADSVADRFHSEIESII